MGHVSIIFHQIYNQFITLCNFSLITIFESNFLSNRKICIIHLYIIYVLFSINKSAEFERRKSKRRKKKKKKNHLDIHEVSEGRRCILRAANNANKSKDNKAPWQPGDRRVPLSRIIETTIAANHVSRSRERWSRVLDFAPGPRGCPTLSWTLRLFASSCRLIARNNGIIVPAIQE